MADTTFQSANMNSRSNFHKSICVRIQDLFTTRNPEGKNSREKYNTMTSSLKGFIKLVMEKNTTLGAFGSGLTWTEINTSTNGIMPDTSSNFNKGMDMVIDPTPANVLPS
jgi:hypothetical protein